MKLVIDRRTLLSTAKRALRAVDNRPTKLILENLLLTVETDLVLVTGTNLEVAIRAMMAIDPECVDASGPPGRSCLLSGRLLGLLEADTSDKVHLGWGEYIVSVKTDDASFTEGTLLPGEFPTIGAWPREKSLWTADLPEGVLPMALGRVLFAADVGSRYATDSVCFCRGNNGKLALTATDARKLASQEIEAGPPAGDILVTQAAAALAMRLLIGPVRIETTENTIFFGDSETLIVARLREGRFPKWQEQLPKRGEGAEVAAGALLAHAKKVAAAACERLGEEGPKIKIVISEEAISMSLVDSLTEAETTIPAVSKRTSETLFFPCHLLPTLGAVRPETIVTVSREGDMVLLSTDDGWRAAVYRVRGKDET